MESQPLPRSMDRRFQAGDGAGEARASLEAARAEVAALESKAREPTETAWRQALASAEDAISARGSGGGGFGLLLFFPVAVFLFFFGGGGGGFLGSLFFGGGGSSSSSSFPYGAQRPWQWCQNFQREKPAPPPCY